MLAYVVRVVAACRCGTVLQYAGYCLFGLLSAILGAVYYSEVGSEFVAVRADL